MGIRSCVHVIRIRTPIVDVKCLLFNLSLISCSQAVYIRNSVARSVAMVIVDVP